MKKTHAEYMQLAIDAAVNGVNGDIGGPFGAIIVNSDTGEVVASACNRVTSTNDPTAHAEVSVIRDACEILNTYDLSGHVIYTSCEPCPMCFGATYWAHLDVVYFAADAATAASHGFDDALIYSEIRSSTPKTKQFAQILGLDHDKPFICWDLKNEKQTY